VLLELRIIAGEPDRVRLPEELWVRRIAISLPGMVEGFELEWMGAIYQSMFSTQIALQKTGIITPNNN